MKKHVNLVLLFLALFAMNALQAQDIVTGLQLYYDFEQVTSNTVPDVSGHGNQGTLSDPTVLQDGLFGKAVKLTQVSQYVTLPNNITSSLTDYTVACWVNIGAPQGDMTYWGRIFDFGNGTTNYMFLCPQSGTPFFGTKNNDSIQEETNKSLKPIEADTWYHIAVTFDYNESTGMGLHTMYINGAPVATNPIVSITPASLGTTNQNYIGKSQFEDPSLNGWVDEFRMYNRALTNSEMLTLYGIPNNLATAFLALSLAGDLNKVETDLTLPTTMANGVTIQWLTSDSSVVWPNGMVFQPTHYPKTAQLTAVLSLIEGGVTYTVSKDFLLRVIPPQPYSDIIALWDFKDTEIGTTPNGATTIRDLSGNNFVATCVGGAQIVTLGNDQKINVLSINKEGEYLDFGTSIGEAVYGLTDYTISLYYRKDTVYGDKDWQVYGQPLYAFSNGTDLADEAVGGMYFEPYRGRHVNTPDNYTSESANFVGSGQIKTPLGSWHNITYTQTQGMGELFYDGVLVGSATMLAPSVNMRMDGRTGTLFNGIGLRPYDVDPALTKTLIGGFSMYAVGFTYDDVLTALNIDSTINALNAAMAATPYAIYDYLELEYVIKTARMTIQTGYVPCLDALNTAITAAQSALNTKTFPPSTISDLWAAINNYTVLQANWLEMKSLLDSADVIKDYDYPGITRFMVAIERAQNAYAAFDVTADDCADLKAAIRSYRYSQYVTPEQPADFTWALVNPGFEEGVGGTLDPTSYLNGKSDGSSGNYMFPKGWTVYLNHTDWCNAVLLDAAPADGLQCYETWAATPHLFNVYQDVELIGGSYELTAKVRTNIQPPYTQHIYAITASGDTIYSGTLIDSLVITGEGWNGQENWQQLSCQFTTKAGIVRLGFKSEGFMQFDDMRLFYMSGRKISTDTAVVTVGKLFQLPIKTSDLSPLDSIIAYQFNMAYDTTKLEFVNYQKAGTLSYNGLVSVNSATKGLLKVGYIGSSFLSGSGPLVNLQFNADQAGEANTAISDFYFNTEPVTNIVNGPVQIFTEYGDVDGNNQIQAYDGALALQYSVGLEPLPNLDPLPWSNWRIVAADVDGVDGITGNDAAMILQRSIDLIGNFPVEGKLRSAMNNKASVVIVQEGDNLAFKSSGELIGLNVFVDENRSVLGTPSISESFISAVNITDDTYAFGIATAYAPSEGSTILTIPVNASESKLITFNLIVNAERVTIPATIVTGLTDENKKAVLLYPNPVVDELHLSHLEVGAVISVYDLSGRVLMTQTAASSSETLTVGSMPAGFYQLVVNTNGTKSMCRFVKK